MLELRPVCENCNTSLPPNSTVAMICSFECTFCRDCVGEVLENVCPNCGGGFVDRPVRPTTNLKNDNTVGKHPAVESGRHRPVDIEEHRRFAETIKNIPSEKR